MKYKLGHKHSQEIKDKLSQTRKRLFSEGKIKSWNKGLSIKEKRVCKNCNKEYLTWQGRNLKFCSTECYHKNRIGKPVNKTNYFKQCDNCGNMIRVTLRRIKDNKRFFCNIECRNNFVRGINSTFYGRHHTEANKELLRQYNIKQFADPTKREKQRLGCLARHHIWTEQERIDYGKMKKRFYQENPEKHPNRILAGHNTSKPQMELYLLVKERYPEAKLEYPVRTLHSTRFADVGIPSLKIDIEFNSDYWHNELLDKIRTEHLNQVGWRVININKLTLNNAIKILEENNGK